LAGILLLRVLLRMAVSMDSASVPPKLRVAIIRPVVIEMSSGGVESCATTTSVFSAVPKPRPIKTA
jgi:hypothetical protein